MIEIEDKKDCCGCWACENACPKHCISMVEDKEGFRYPQVDMDSCIDCHLCEKVCPVINAKADVAKEQKAFLLQHKDEKVLHESASGGAFTWSIPASTHGVSNVGIIVRLYQVSTGEMVIADVTVNQSNYNVTITINDTASAGSLASGTYRVVIFG